MLCYFRSLSHVTDKVLDKIIKIQTLIFAIEECAVFVFFIRNATRCISLLCYCRCIHVNTFVRIPRSWTRSEVNMPFFHHLVGHKTSSKDAFDDLIAHDLAFEGQRFESRLLGYINGDRMCKYYYCQHRSSHSRFFNWHV